MTPPITVDCTRRGVARLRLARPERRNALDGELMDELARIFTALDEDPAMRVIVLTGAGTDFCSGADLRWVTELAQDAEGGTERFARALTAMVRCRKLVIARVEGRVYAGGLSLMAAADVVLAEASARFALTEVRIGMAPALTTSMLLARIAPGHVHYLGITGAPITAEHALRMGLVHHLATGPAALDALEESHVTGGLRSAPEAIARFKETMPELRADGSYAPGDYAKAAFASGRHLSSAEAGIAAVRAKAPLPWVDA